MALQVWLPLNGDLKNNGLLDISVVNHGAIVNTNGKIGSCYQFNNNNSYIALQHTELYKILNGDTQPFSICFWVKQIDTSRAILFGDFNVSGGNNFNIELTTGHALRWYWGTPDLGISAMNVGQDVWHHITFTYSGTVLKGYMDGVEKYSRNGVLTAKNRTSGEYYLGRDGRTGTTTLNGYLNDFRIYDHCLSPKEVKEISKGLVLHFPLNQPNFNIANGGQKLNLSAATTNSNWSTRGTVEKVLGTHGFMEARGKAAWSGISCWANNLNLVVGQTYTISFYAYTTEPSLASGNEISFYPMMYNSAGTRDTSSQMPIGVMGGAMTNANSKPISTLTATPVLYWATFIWNQTMADIISNGGRIELSIQTHNTYNSTVRKIIYAPKLEASDIPTFWQGSLSDESLITIPIYDTSGYCINGITTGTLTTVASSPRYNCATHFNGTFDIRTENDTFGWWDFQEGTVSAWMKPTANASGWFGSIGVQFDGNAGNRSFNIADYANKASWVIGYDTQWGQSQSNITMTTNVWYHLALTITNGTTVTLYVNGEAVKTGTVTNNSGVINTNTKFAVGVDLPGSDERFTGDISDVRFYTTALSADDIRQLYKVPAIVDNAQNLYAYQFIEDNKHQVQYTGIFDATSFVEDTKVQVHNDGQVKANYLYEL